MGVTFGGTALTLLGKHIGGVELWGLQNPSTGTKTIQVSYSAVPQLQVGGSVSYFNVASVGTPSSADLQSNSPSVVVSTVAGDLVVDTLVILSVSEQTASPTGPGQTQRWNSGPFFLPPGFWIGAGSDQPASGPSVTMSWSLSTSASWALIAVPLLPVTTPIPEYPLGLAILAILMIVAYALVKRRVRTGP